MTVNKDWLPLEDRRTAAVFGQMLQMKNTHLFAALSISKPRIASLLIYRAEI